MSEPRRTRTATWRDGGIGLAFTMVVAVPTLVVAEDWHGRPLIDQGGLGWLVPALVVAAAFATGGAIAGRGRRLGPATAAGLTVGVLGVLVLIAADGVRRMLMNPTLPMGVVAYWLEGAAVSVVLATVGAAVRAGFGAGGGARRGGRPAPQAGGEAAVPTVAWRRVPTRER